ncbi:hypothetical protein [Bradyrhizobium sp. NAS80.1]|uniref:hypothetical protein n=1 Tax=Bradyrhizobium sp. NAS80.1 TaxID=1680159 RepID=UPI00143E0721|nr:hypothetical protein [Bradyrhizobium sp. NAS80.1]
MARVFALRQAFAGFTSGKVLKKFAEDKFGDANDIAARRATSVAATANRSHVQLR